MRHFTPLLFALVSLSTLSTYGIEVDAAGRDGDVRGIVREAVVPTQSRAEEIFASAEAAAWFPALGRVRWLSTDIAAAAGQGPRPHPMATLREFEEGLERDFPRFRERAYGPYLLKQPATIAELNAGHPSAEPLAVVFTESFESGMANWTITNNTADLYSWGATTCEARSGTHAADAMRGGVNTLTCNDAYAPNVTTMMVHKSCESLQGASQAWLDAYIHLASESGSDKLGFYYADPSGSGYGYLFSGNANAWFHVVFNLRQWYRVGDLAAASCPRLALQFTSNATNQSGIGARVDDITIGNAAPGFLTASMTATPSTGVVPLTVTFASTVTGATAATSYSWSFGDAAASTATTPTATFTYTTAGDYWPRLAVSDSGVQAFSQTLVHATAVPTCSVTCTATAPATATAGSAALFQATATASGCSGTASYSWTFGDGQTSTAQNASHAYAAPGTYNWTLTTSIGGTSCTKSGSIAVTAAGRSRMRVVKPPAPTPLASASIGPAGGSVSGGGLTVTVAPGALATTSTIGLTRITSRRDEGAASDTYGITGLPTKLAAGLTIGIDVSGSSLGAGESYYISATAAMYAKSKPYGQQDVATMVPVAATVSGSRVSITLPASWPMAKSAAATPPAESEGVRPAVSDDAGELMTKVEQLVKVQTDHFMSTVPISKSATVETILNMLEKHYQTIVDLGFSFDCRKDGAAFRKIAVAVRDLGTDLGEHVSGGDPCGTNWLFASDSLAITTAVPTTDDRVNATAAHELFHLVQDMYSPGGARANLWLKEASSIWLENALGLCPDVQNSYANFAWNGLFNSRNSAVPAFWTSDRETRHGYGASYYLKYRTDGGAGSHDRLLINVWTRIKSGSSELAAFQGLGTTSLEDSWTLFAKSYYGLTPAASCFPSAWSFDVESIANERVLPRSISFDAYPLSAHSWLLDVSKFKSAAEQPVTIRSYGLKSNQRIVIYDRKADTELATLTQENIKYEIADLNKLSGTFLVAWFIDTNLPEDNANNISSTNVVALAIGDETKLDKFPWSFQTQWNDDLLGSAAVWTSTGSGIVEAPKGSTVTVDSALAKLPSLKIRSHTAIGRVIVSGNFTITIKPMSGRKTNADGSYMDFTWSNPQLYLDHDGTASGNDFRYEIAADENQAGLIHSWGFDFKATCYEKDGKPKTCNTFTGAGAGMIIDFERNE